MATFMGLPLELRNLIYEYCLVKKHTLIPYPEQYPLVKVCNPKSSTSFAPLIQ